VEEMSVPATGKILLMDDEERIRTVTGQILRMLGYEAEIAPNGQEAVEMYRQAMEAGVPFSAVILDLTIPGGMGGKEAIKKLLEIDPDVKAIVSSGYSNDPIMTRFREYGFSGIVAKPYRVAELKKALDDVIEGQGQ
jgi:CheY-like chemotaxis protein